MDEDNNHKKRWGDQAVRFGAQPTATALEVAVASALIGKVFSDPLENAREALRMAGHAKDTVSDFVQGGPEGMRAAERANKNLDEALAMVEKAAAQNQEAAVALKGYLGSRKDFLQNILGVYQENETVSRVCSRLSVQLKGALKNFFEIGNDLKPDWFKENVDGPIIGIYGKGLRMFGHKDYKDLSDDELVVKALESSANLKKFYQEVRGFYDARKKNENTIMQFCDFLGNTEKSAVEQNKKIDECFPGLISTLKEGYSVEDYIFEVDRKGASMKKSEVAQVGQKVDNFEKDVDKTREMVGQNIPLKEIPAQPFSYIDIITNPVLLGAAAVFAYKGIMFASQLGFADNILSKAICYPIKKAGNMANNIYDGIKAYFAKPKEGGNEK